MYQQLQQSQQQQIHPRQQQNNLQSQQSPGDSFSHVYAGNMSKFFDFHKNQQQQQQQNQQQQFLLNGHTNSIGSGPQQQQQHNVGGNDHMNMASLLENNRLNSQFLEHSNSGKFKLNHLLILCTFTRTTQFVLLISDASLKLLVKNTYSLKKKSLHIAK